MVKKIFDLFKSKKCDGIELIDTNFEYPKMAGSYVLIKPDVEHSEGFFSGHVVSIGPFVNNEKGIKVNIGEKVSWGGSYGIKFRYRGICFYAVDKWLLFKDKSMKNEEILNLTNEICRKYFEDKSDKDIGKVMGLIFYKILESKKDFYKRKDFSDFMIKAFEIAIGKFS